MYTPSINLFIVDNNPMIVRRLHSYLLNMFGPEFKISTFEDSESVMKNIGTDTGIIIVDSYLEDAKGNSLYKSLKTASPKTEIIVFSNIVDAGEAVEMYRKGISGIEFIQNDKKSFEKIYEKVRKIINYPIHVLSKEFQIGRYMAIFLITSVLMGISIVIALKIMQ